MANVTGFSIHVPQVQTTQYEISGADCQVLTVTLAPGQSVESEPGTMMFMASEIHSHSRCAGCTRTCAGESMCVVHYRNDGSGQAFVALTPNFPAKVVPVNLDEIGNSYVCKKGAYFGHVGEVHVGIDCDCNPCTCCFGGLGFIRQKLEGQGTVFLAAGGTVLQKNLAPQERLVIDTDSIVGWESTASLGVKAAGGCCTCLCGGEGFFNTTVTGPGLVVIQSMSFEKYKKAVAPPMQNDKMAANTEDQAVA